MKTFTGTISKGTPPRAGKYRVYDKDKKPLGYAHWHGEKWGPRTFDAEQLNSDPSAARAQSRIVFWGSGVKAQRKRTIPFETVTIRGDVTQVLLSTSTGLPIGVILRPHVKAGEEEPKKVYCTIPAQLSQDVEGVSEEGALEILGQRLLEPLRQWRGEVGDQFTWVQAIHLKAIPRKRSTPIRPTISLRGSRLKLTAGGKTLNLTVKATNVLRQMLGE